MKEKKTYRLNDFTLKKLDLLVGFEKQQAEQYNVKAKNMTEIIEDAINEYYVMKMDNDTGTDYLTRMNLMIQDALKQQNLQRDVTLHHILRYTMMAYEASVTMLKIFRLPDKDRPKNFDDARNLVQNLDSIFEDSIYEKVAKEFGEEVD
ncbi:hypothetical protein MKC73_01015 [[Clostridium] innocuum]|nr:hypothetical protein [[Clostridium] innocuum]